MTTKHIILQPELEKAIKDLGFLEFTTIQEKAIPLIQQGLDVIGQSATGSGKTAAFGLPTIEKLHTGGGLQLLILVPTRELCNQVAKEMRKFAKYKKLSIVEVFGGVSLQPQMQGLQHAEIAVATPGRLLDHLNRRTAHLSKVKILILDEADKMFEMGFVEDVQEIISHTPKERQTLLFSATMSDEVTHIVRHSMHNPTKVVAEEYVDKSLLAQEYYDVPSRDKFSLALHIITHELDGTCITFCATRHMVDNLEKNLIKQGINAQALHGGLSQARRQDVMSKFRQNNLDVLIASDVAARGIDIKDIALILNYDIPKTSKEYIHRIGRTARAGMSGKVISLVAPQDHENFSHVLDDREIVIQRKELPEFMHVPFFRPQGSSRGPPRGFGSRGFGGEQRGYRGERAERRGFRPRRGFGNRRGFGKAGSQRQTGQSESRPINRHYID